MKDEKMMRAIHDAPIHAPFKEGHCEPECQAIEGRIPVKKELRLGMPPAMDALRPVHANVKIYKFRMIQDAEVTVEKLKRANQQWQRCLEMGEKGTRLKEHALTFESMRKLLM
jgi:hypothetical protein